jgi:hypothetical protein
MNSFSTLKIKLNPTKEQLTIMHLWGEYSRDVYDHALSSIKKCYIKAMQDNGVPTVVEPYIISADELITAFRNSQVTGSLYYTCPSSVCDGAIRKAYNGVWLFDKGKYLFMPKCSYERKGLGKAKLSFFIFPRDVKFTEDSVSLNILKDIKLAEKGRAKNIKKFKTSLCCVYDGKDWYITVNIPVTKNQIDEDTKNNNKPQIRESDKTYIKLISEYKRLNKFVGVCMRKKRLSQNHYRATMRMKGHAIYIANIILDIENKYDCTYIGNDIKGMKKSLRMLLNAS